VRWPIAGSNKRQYISEKPESEYLLVPNATYVVMRRFSAKEEHRRIVAAALLEGQLPGRTIGLENHLNSTGANSRPDSRIRGRIARVNP
jgi:hypothetical protein